MQDYYAHISRERQISTALGEGEKGDRILAVRAASKDRIGQRFPIRPRVARSATIRMSHSDPLPKRAFWLLMHIMLVMFIVMALTIGKDVSTQARRVIFGQREVQIFVPYSGSAPVTLPPVLIVAHNAGDQEATVRRALNHGATAIEIDVRSLGGVLYATHSAPPELMPLRLWQAPRLWEAWRYTRSAEVLKLDLKSTDDLALDALAQFIENHPTDRQLIVVSKSPEVLAYFESKAPDALGLLSLATGLEIDTLLQNRKRPDGVDGVSIPAWVLSDQRILLLTEQEYLIDAWAVNDVARLIDLTALGVDIITTDNLAFFDMQIDRPPGAGLD